MVDLLPPRSPSAASPAVTPASGSGPARPLALGAAAAGVASPAVALLLLWAVGLVGWFAADGGSHGTTRSVLRVAADGWLLAHGAHLSVGQSVVVTASPLGLTLACLVLTYRLGRWAGAASAVEDLRAAGFGTVVLAGAYALTALVVALLASAPGAHPGLRTALLGGALVGAAGGGTGLVRGAGLTGALLRSARVGWLGAGLTAALTAAATVTAGALLVAVALAVRAPAAANVAEQLALDATGSALSLALVAALAPNLALMGAGYLLGPGFALGTGTVVAPDQVALGPVPAVPVLAALPPDGWAPEWAAAALAVPVACALAGSVLAARALPTRSYRSAALRGAAGGAAAALALALLADQAGGAIGPGRMADTGVPLLPTVRAALTLLVPGTLAGALAAAWWARRRGVEPAAHPGPVARRDSAPVVAEVPAPRSAPPAAEDLSGEATVRLPLGATRRPPAG